MNYLIILFTFILSLGNACQAQHAMKTVSKNDMQVKWHYKNNRVYFEMSAPTKGWVTIGFNHHPGISQAYLLMGRVTGTSAEVVEHYTLTPGNYKPITDFGVAAQVKHVSGEQMKKHTRLKFSLPVQALSHYQKSLFEHTSYTMILAYSTATDFQHHSIMRTSIKIKL